MELLFLMKIRNLHLERIFLIQNKMSELDSAQRSLVTHAQLQRVCPLGEGCLRSPKEVDPGMLIHPKLNLK